MKFVMTRFKRYDGLFLILAAGLVLLNVATAGSGFPLDDSWIHQVYGRNLAETGQWAFVPGEPSAASTSPLYTVLLSIGYKTGLPYALWTHALGVLALAIAAMIGARIGERLSDSKYAGLLTGLALVGSWHLVWASSAGMETMLFCMWTLALIALVWREQDMRNTVIQNVVGGFTTSSPDPLSNAVERRDAGDSQNAKPFVSSAIQSLVLRGVVFGIVAALMTLTRPEGLLLIGLAGLFVLIVRPQGSLQKSLIWGVVAGMSFLIVLAPYLLLNLQLTGGLLPDTAAAKMAKIVPHLAASYPARVVDMAFPLIAGGQLLLLPGIIYFAVSRRWRLFDLLPLIWAVSLILLYAARLPAPYQHGRYVIPALPSLMVIGVTGSIALFRLAQKSVVGRVITRTVAASAALLFVYFVVVVGPSVNRVDVSIINEEMVASAHWIAANVPPSQLLAIHDIGAVGYFAPRPILDIAGLVSPEVVPIILDKDGLYTLMKARNARYLMAFPDQVPGVDLSDPRLCPVFTTNGTTSPRQGGYNMTVYALAWDGICTQR